MTFVPTQGSTSRSGIPKIIMQTWKTSQVPDRWKSSPEAIHRLMPDWEYVLMTDEMNLQFVRSYFPDFLPYYEKFPHNIQRADAIRYMWLYRHGGIYMDLDIELVKPLDDLFTANNESYFVRSGNLGGWFTNSIMASKPRAQIWLECLNAMKKPLPWWAIGKHLVVHRSTGPLMLTHVVNKTKQIYGILPAAFLTPCNICNLPCSAPNAYVRTLEGSSWVSYDSIVYNFFLCHWKTVFTVIAVVILILILWIIKRSCW